MKKRILEKSGLEDLHEIQSAASKMIQGTRYPDELEKRTCP